MEQNILLAGFGGQGILFFGKVIAYAGLIAGYEVSWLPSYGPEMRGGTANCSVCISKDPIASPLVLNPNMLVALNSPSVDKFLHKVKAGGTILVDNSLVTEKVDSKDVTAAYIPATQMAIDNNIIGLANMIMLGRVITVSKMFEDEIMLKAINQSIPSSKIAIKESNIKAYELGRKYS